jgi:hypothetical protein
VAQPVNTRSDAQMRSVTCGYAYRGVQQLVQVTCLHLMWYAARCGNTRYVIRVAARCPGKSV